MLEITKVLLKLEGKEIELTADEARQVQKELNRLFDMEKTEIQKFKDQWEKDNPKTLPIPILHPAYPPYQPIIIDRQPWEPTPWTPAPPRFPYWTTLCSVGGTNTLCIDLSGSANG